MAAVFELNKLYYFPSFQANNLFHFKKILSTKFDLKRALVLMVKKPSEASLHKLKGSPNHAERSEAQIFFNKDQ